jgi:pyruvate-formate lyase-activating enzyme
MALELPTIVSIETTVRCTSDCIICPHKEVLQRRTNLDMPTDMVYDIINQIDWPCQIQWGWMGEPLTDPRLLEFIQYAHTKGLHGFINSNGSLLKGEIVDKLLKVRGLDFVNFAMDTMDKTKYEKCRKGLQFEEVRDNITQLLRRRTELNSNLPVNIAQVEIPGLNDGEFEALKLHWYAKGVNCVHSPHYRRRKGEYDLKVTKPVPTGKICYFLTNEMNITTDGDVPLCACDALVENKQASILTSSLKEAWNTPDRESTVWKIAEGGKSSLKWCKETVRDIYRGG